jgi:hypothetical protein
MAISVSCHSSSLFTFIAPFKDECIDGDSEFSQLQISAVLYIALLMKTNIIQNNEGVYDFLLVSIVFSIFLLSPYRYFTNRWKTYNRYLPPVAPDDSNHSGSSNHSGNSNHSGLGNNANQVQMGNNNNQGIQLNQINL